MVSVRFIWLNAISAEKGGISWIFQTNVLYAKARGMTQNRADVLASVKVDRPGYSPYVIAHAARTAKVQDAAEVARSAAAPEDEVTG